MTEQQKRWAEKNKNIEEWEKTQCSSKAAHEGRMFF